MSAITLRGMTWEHRRAIDPLKSAMPAFRARHSQVDVAWSSRSLHAFEFAPIERLAQEFDLIVLDHPFIGEIVATRCLEPLDSLFDDDLASAFVGPSLASYVANGSVWAMPVDAACQVAAARPDLLAALDSNPPNTWSELYELGRRARRRGLSLAIGLRGVHSLMTLFTLCANLGRPCAVEPNEPLVDVETARIALDAMRHLLAYCPPEVLDWNSIALHDEMVARDDLLYCPAVYCYATYAEGDMRKPLSFHDLPGLAGRSCSGSTIGGTGIGLSAHCREKGAARDFLRYMAESGTQKAFADHHGQPARWDAWSDPAIDRRFNKTYSNTLRTMEQCWIRPRYRGYLSFQAKSGELVEAHLRGLVSEAELLGKLEALHREGRSL